MELKLNEEDRQKLVMELAKEIADKQFPIHEREHKPEDISEFRFVHPFRTVDDFLSLYLSSKDFGFYDVIAENVPGISLERKKELNLSKLTKLIGDEKYPLHLGLVYVPSEAVEQDRYFDDYFTLNVQKTRNWRGNVLTVILDKDSEHKVKIPTLTSPQRFRMAIATFKKNEEGLFVTDKYFIKSV